MGLKRSTSGSKCTIFREDYDDEKKNTLDILEAISGATAMSRKEKIFVEEFELVASSTMSTEESNDLQKIIKTMAPVCCVSETDLTILVEKHELGSGEDVNNNL